MTSWLPFLYIKITSWLPLLYVWSIFLIGNVYLSGIWLGGGGTQPWWQAPLPPPTPPPPRIIEALGWALVDQRSECTMKNLICSASVQCQPNQQKCVNLAKKGVEIAIPLFYLFYLFHIYLF